MAITPPTGHLDLRLIEHPDFARRDLSSLVKPANVLRPTPSAGSIALLERVRADRDLHPRDRLAGRPQRRRPPGRAGRALPGWTVKVTDPDRGTLCPRGTVGQFRVRGPALMRGYYGRPGPVLDEAGVLRHPRRRVARRGGFLWFSSRIDDIVRSAGVNVSTLELERELEASPRVRQAIVLGVPHPTVGQALVACIVAEDGSLGTDDVLAWLRPRVATYKLPRAVLFFGEDEITYTVSQKVQRGELREAAIARIDDLGLF